jgi:methylmalonyl-CoA decarboxylase subunit alpha
MQLCDTFQLPLVSLADEPGFMVGPNSERHGIERAGARLVATVCNSRMPWITIVIGKLYGIAGQCQHRPTGMYRRYAWPSANWGSMHITGGVAADYRREIAAAPDPEAKRQEIEARLQALASPFLTAEATGQDIIDPRDTRSRLVEFVHDAQRILKTQLGDRRGCLICPDPRRGPRQWSRAALRGRRWLKGSARFR